MINTTYVTIQEIIVTRQYKTHPPRYMVKGQLGRDEDKKDEKHPEKMAHRYRASVPP